MARIRYIKPDFFTDEDLAELPFEHRLFYQGLWCHADRDGRLQYRPKKLKALIMPYDNVDVAAICATLAEPHIPHRPEKVFIIMYEVAGEKYIQIPKLSSHQNFHPGEKSQHLPGPAPSDTSSNVPATCQPVADQLQATSRQLVSTTGTGTGIGTENGDGDGKCARPLEAVEPDRIDSDTPLPPVLQAEWEKFLEDAPKPQRNRDRAIRLFVRSAERARILRNAKHWASSRDAADGIVMGLDRFVAEGYRDFDDPPEPTGRGQPNAREELLAALRNKANRHLPRGHLSEAAVELFYAAGKHWDQLQAEVIAGNESVVTG